MSKPHNPEPALVLGDHNGIYIPQLWCSGIDQEEAALFCIDWEDVQTCQVGPGHDCYWEAWHAIERSASWTDQQGITWYLHQDGDLWAVPEGYEWEADS